LIRIELLPASASWLLFDFNQSLSPPKRGRMAEQSEAGLLRRTEIEITAELPGLEKKGCPAECRGQRADDSRRKKERTRREGTSLSRGWLALKRRPPKLRSPNCFSQAWWSNALGDRAFAAGNTHVIEIRM
jgi:hypothetical protein